MALDRLPRGGGGHFDLSASVEAVERAWVHCTLRYGRQRIRGGDLLVAILHTRSLRHGLLAMSSEFAKLRAEALADDLDDIVAGSPEDDATDVAAAVAPLGLAQQVVLRRSRCTRSTSPHKRARASWTRSSAATTRFARSSIS